jgi:hypothetical protein
MREGQRATTPAPPVESYPADKQRLRFNDRHAYLTKSREGFCQHSGTFVAAARAMRLLAWCLDIIEAFASDWRLIDANSKRMILPATPV